MAQPNVRRRKPNRNAHLPRRQHLLDNNNRPPIRKTRPIHRALGGLLADLGLTVAELEEEGFKFPLVDHVALEGRYTVEDDFLTIELTQFFLGIQGDDRYVELGQFYADTAHQLLELLNRETIDLEVILTLTVLAESGPQIAAVVVEGMMEEGPFVASGFTIQDDHLRFHEGDFAGVGYIRQEDETSVRTTSWGQIKGRIK